MDCLGHPLLYAPYLLWSCASESLPMYRRHRLLLKRNCCSSLSGETPDNTRCHMNRRLPPPVLIASARGTGSP